MQAEIERLFDEKPQTYTDAYFRLFHDFSTGIIDQWMTHHIDAVHMLTGATFPKSAVAHGGTYAWKDHRENGDRSESIECGLVAEVLPSGEIIVSAQ